MLHLVRIRIPPDLYDEEEVAECLPYEHGGGLHVRVEEEFVVGSFVNQLSILVSVGCMEGGVPRVFIAPVMIMSPMMMFLAVAVRSGMIM